MATARRMNRAAVAALAMAALGAAAPEVARAATLTVDDDRADCPSAGYVSVQSAVDAAQGGDTVVICAGTYVEGPGGPGAAATQPGTNGVSITKSITVRGAGADRVTIRPNPVDGASLVGAAQDVRDAAGSVLSVHRVGDRVITDVSGLTVEGNGVLVDSGIKFFNAEGSVRNVRVRDLVRPTAPLDLGQTSVGYGMVVATNLAADVFQVAVASSDFSDYNEGGLLVDSVDPAAPGGSAPEGAKLVATVSGSVFTGAGPQAAVTQEGIRVAGNARGTYSTSLLTGHDYTPDPEQGAAVRLAGADLSLVSGSIATPALTQLQVTNNLIEGNGYGLLSSELGSTAPRPVAVTATANWWGSGSGPSIAVRTVDRGGPVSGTAPGPAPNTTTSVNYSGFRTARQAPPVAPGATTDAAPTGSIDAPGNGDTVRPGVPITMRASAFDDIGVKRVEFFAPDGTSLGSDDTAPYVASTRFTPSAAQDGSDLVLRAIVTDSANTATPLVVTVKVHRTPAPVREGSPGGGPRTGSGATDGTPVAVEAAPEPGVTAPPAAPASRGTASPMPVSSRTNPVTPVLRRPTGLTLRVARDTRRRVAVSGRLSVAGRCERGGRVQVTFSLAGKRVLRRTTALSATCRYSLRVTAPVRTRGRKVRVSARFMGTPTIAPRSARSLGVGVSKR